jgi:hypothetical protein
MVLTALAPLARARTKLQTAERMPMSVSGLMKANRRSLGRMANQAPKTMGTKQMSNPKQRRNTSANNSSHVTSCPSVEPFQLGNNAGAKES